MVSSKMLFLLEMARKWQRLAKRNKRVKMQNDSFNRYSTEGHFAVYALDGNRYEVPLAYLNHPIFKELLEMAVEEFGLVGQGPLILPCQGELMDYIVPLLRKNPSEQVEKALLFLTCSSPTFLFHIPASERAQCDDQQVVFAKATDTTSFACLVSP